jgi:hypothetical protein
MGIKGMFTALYCIKKDYKTALDYPRDQEEEYRQGISINNITRRFCRPLDLSYAALA